MTEPDHTFRQATLLPDEPTQQELAEAEAQLAELPPAAPLSDAEIAALMARAVAPVRRARRRTTTQHLVAASIMATLCLGALATLVQLWPSRQHSPERMNYPTAVALAKDPTSEESARITAIGMVHRRINYAATFLFDLSKSPSSALATKAQSIRLDALEIFRQESHRPPPPMDEHLLAWIAQVSNEELPLPLRQQALEQIQDLMTGGLQTILTVELDSDAAKETRDEYLLLVRENLER